MRKMDFRLYAAACLGLQSQPDVLAVGEPIDELSVNRSV